MEEKHELEQTVKHLKHYADVKWKLIQMDVTEKISSLVSSFVSIAVFVLIGIFTLLFGSIGIAIWIGRQNENTSMGFLILTGFYLLLFVILYSMRKSLIKIPLLNLIIRKLFADEGN
jgi:hypothetical protein